MANLQALQSIVKWNRLERVRADLLNAFSTLLSQEALILAMNNSFVDPFLQFEAQLELVHSCFNMVFSLPVIGRPTEMEKSTEDYKDIQFLYNTILSTYENILLILVSKDFYKLQFIKEIITWMNEEPVYMQKKVMKTIVTVLDFASRKANTSSSVDAPCLGELAAELALLCNYQRSPIVQQASLGMHHLLCIAIQQTVLYGKERTRKDAAENWVQKSDNDLEISPAFLQRNSTRIATCVGDYLIPPQLTDFVWSLLNKLSNSSSAVASEAAVLLRVTLEKFSYKVTMVSKVLDSIYIQLNSSITHPMKYAMLRVISLFVCTCPKKIIFLLLDYPVPADSTLILMWHAVSSESKVACEVLKTILTVLKGKPGEDEENPKVSSRKRFSVDAVNMMPVAASQALCILLPAFEYKIAVAEFFPQLLMALILQLYYSGNFFWTKKQPLYARDALRILLRCSGLFKVDAALQEKKCWEHFPHQMFYHRGVYLVAKTLSQFKFPQFPKTLHYLYKLSVEGPRRVEDSITIVIFLIELLSNFFKDPFPEPFLILFRKWVSDSDPAVCKLSLKKIACMAPVVNEMENPTELLLAILDAFSSQNGSVVIQAMHTLRSLLNVLDKLVYASVCNRIASSYCPLLDHGLASVRALSIRHFGELLKDMNEYSWLLKDEVFKALVPLILFLEDKKKAVVEACKYTLNICAPHLKWTSASLLTDRNYRFEIVVLNICKSLFSSHGTYITELISESLGFFKSSRAYLRRAAVIFIGYLAKLGGHILLNDEIEIMMEALEKLLNDQDPTVVQVAERTRRLFKDLAIEMSTSNFKQSLRRMFSFMYFRDSALIYNYEGKKSYQDSQSDLVISVIAHQDGIEPGLEIMSEASEIITLTPATIRKRS
ncbi:maestro heat-like repeat-containing protein family member 9 isoform X2 [Ornithorhynchus anatinus]|uniref:maestro heat-like repeat-containing protein family member 9 isoform X2 n=1 Tax=Ornithorhynchus anatinus TaxID=9258 RepID=UPI0010A7A826|nr:maestro heat-like repeat-containing protein family member 9 isoform X2 [Ornithorhynchus anatinus]